MADPTKDFSFFFGARCAHAVCPGSHLWQSTGIIKNHQPINLFVCFFLLLLLPVRERANDSASPWTFCLLKRDLLIGFSTTHEKEKKNYAAPLQLDPGDVINRRSPFSFVCGFVFFPPSSLICIFRHAMWWWRCLLVTRQRISFLSTPSLYLSAHGCSVSI